MKTSFNFLHILLLLYSLAAFAQGLPNTMHKNEKLKKIATIHPTPAKPPTALGCKDICDGDLDCISNCQASCDPMYSTGKCPTCIKHFCGPDYLDSCSYKNCIDCTIDSSDQTPEGIYNCAVCLEECDPSDTSCYLSCTLGVRKHINFAT